MKELRYDPGVLRDHAAKLTAATHGIVRNFMLMGSTVGAAAGIAASRGSLVAGLVGGVFGLAAAWVMGQDRKEQMLREAATALCLVQMEENTRARDEQGAMVPLFSAKERLSKPAPERPSEASTSVMSPAASSSARPAVPAGPTRAQSALETASVPSAASRLSRAVSRAPEPPPSITADDGLPSYAARESSGAVPPWLAKSPATAPVDTATPSYAAVPPPSEESSSLSGPSLAPPVAAPPAPAAPKASALPSTDDDALVYVSSEPTPSYSMKQQDEDAAPFESTSDDPSMATEVLRDNPYADVAVPEGGEPVDEASQDWTGVSWGSAPR